jgi:dihydropyrimidinase
MVGALSTNTAKLFGLTDKGEVTVGKDADLVIFDPKQKFTVSQSKLHMNVDYTPWEGCELTGMPWAVYSRGRKVAEWDGKQMQFVGKIGAGKFVKRQPREGA